MKMLEIVRKEYLFKNENLGKATERIYKIGDLVKKNMFNVALELHKVEENKLYVDDFSTIIEYAEVMFGFKKSLTYSLLKTATRYKDDRDLISGYSVSQLERLNRLTEEESKEAIRNNEIVPDMTVKQIEDIVKEKMGKPRADKSDELKVTVKTYSFEEIYDSFGEDVGNIINMLASGCDKIVIKM